MASDYTGTENLEVMADAVNYTEFLVELVLSHATREDLILDFGAGIGTISRRVSARGYRVSCVEPDPKQAAVLSESGLAVFRSLDQVGDGSLDYIYTLNVLEHIEDDRATLIALHGKLKRGGRLLIYVPAFEVLYSSMDRKVGHRRRYTRGSLRQLARDAGFRIQGARYADSLGFFASILYRWVGGESGTINRRALVAYDRAIFPLSLVADRLLGRVFGKNALLLGVKQ
jgi:SAM-dependent methyltransferase